MGSNRVVGGSILTLLVLSIATLYMAKYIEYRQALQKEAKARLFIEIGDNIDAVRTKLEKNGFTVSAVENQKGFGTSTLRVTLTELGKMDSFRYGTDIDLTPFSYEPKHWLIIETQVGSERVVSVTSK